MAGVTSPMLRERPSDGVRLLIGLMAGGIAAALMVSMVAYVVGTVAQALAPTQGRLLLLAGVCAMFGTADLLNRTPHVWRQVPQRLVRVLAPGRLGTVWGFDIGLLFTTQKVVSLMWAALAAAVLLDPTLAPALLVGMAALWSTTIAIWSLSGGGGVLDHGSNTDRRWLRSVRAMSGTLLLVVSLITLVEVLQA